MCRAMRFKQSVGPASLMILLISIILLVPVISLIPPGAAMATAQPYTILWQQPGMGKTGLPPAVSPWGDIFLPSGSGLLRLDAHGRKIWEARLPAKAASQPVFFTDGSTFVATGKALHEVKPYGRTGWSFTLLTGEKGSRAAVPNLTPGPGDLFYLLLGSSLYAVAPRRNMV